MRVMPYFRRFKQAAIIVVLAAGCVEGRNPIAPESPRRPLIQADWTPGPIGQSHTLTTPPWNTSATPWEPVNVTIPAGAPARVTVTGMLTFTVNQGYVDCWGSAPPPLPGGLTSVGPAGFPSPGGWAVVVLKDSSRFSVSPSDPSASTTAAYIQGPGSVGAGRPYGVGGACGNPQSPFNPAYSVSGSQAVSVELLDSARATPDRNAGTCRWTGFESRTGM